MDHRIIKTPLTISLTTEENITRGWDVLRLRRNNIKFDANYDTNWKKNYNKLREAISTRKNIVGRYPLNIQIQTISTCNGKCAFCPYQGSWHEKNPGKMSWATYEKIIRDLMKYKIRKFCPYFENEPLLDPSLFEKIRYAVEHLDIGWVELSTNMSPLTNDKIDEIRKTFSKVPHEIWISFHGVSKESYENIMGLSYERSLKNVFQMVELSQRMPLNIVIRGSGSPKEEGKRAMMWFGEREYTLFWQKHLANFRKKPKISFFQYHDRTGSSQLRDKGIVFDAVARNDLSGFYCVRFDRWLHFLYTGEPVLCCMDYNRETAFCQTVKHKTIEDLFSSSHFVEMIKKGTGMISSEDNFICKRCISPGG